MSSSDTFSLADKTRDLAARGDNPDLSIFDCHAFELWQLLAETGELARMSKDGLTVTLGCDFLSLTRKGSPPTDYEVERILSAFCIPEFFPKVQEEAVKTGEYKIRRYFFGDVTEDYLKAVKARSKKATQKSLTALSERQSRLKLLKIQFTRERMYEAQEKES